MASVSVHEGPLATIPANSSPGILFLKALLPVLDSLSPAPSSTSLAPFMGPSTRFIFNGIPPTTLDGILPKFSSRGENMSVFRHDVVKVWDIGSGGKRTVMYESVSVSVFKADKEEKLVEVPEFNILELEEVHGGFEGLIATELRVYMDASPVMQRMTVIKGI
jgi:hypothetical protein